MPANLNQEYVRTEERIAANKALEALTEDQMRRTLGVIIADSFLLPDEHASRVLERIIKQ